VTKKNNISTHFSRTGDTNFSENPLHRLSSLKTVDGRTDRQTDRQTGREMLYLQFGLACSDKNVKSGNAHHVQDGRRQHRSI